MATGNPLDDDVSGGVAHGPQDANSNPLRSDVTAGGDSSQSTATSGLDWPSAIGLGRRLGMGVRDVIEGASAPLTGAADVLTWPGRALQRAVGIPTDAPSTLVDRGLNLTGLPMPQTPGEQATSTAVRGAASMLPGMGLGAIPSVAARVPALAPASTPAGAIATPIAGGTGALTGQSLASLPEVPAELKPTVNVAGNIAGGGLANVGTRAGELLFNSLTGNLSRVRQAFDTLGITPPSVSAVSGGPTSRTAEAAASNVLGGQEVMVPRNQAAVRSFGNANDDTAAMLHFNATGNAGVVPSAAVAGSTAQDAIRDWRYNGQNPDSFVATQDRMYQPVNTRMAGQYVDPSGYRAALQGGAVDQMLAGMPETQAALARPQVQKLLDALNADAKPGQMITWEQAQALRRRIGDMTGTPAFQQDLGTQVLGRIYAGIAGDLQNAADGAGVGNQFRGANAYSTSGYNFINRVASRAVQTNNPSQDIAPETAANQLLALPGSDLAQLRQNVPAAADTLAGYKIASMDTPTPGRQTEPGQTSTETFLTNLNRSRADSLAHDALFNADPAVAARVNAAGTVAQQLRQAAQYTNTSRTSYTNLALGLIPSTIAGLETHGLLGALSAAATTVGIPYGTAKVLTNPALVRLMGAQPAGPRVPARLTGATSSLLGL